MTDRDIDKTETLSQTRPHSNSRPDYNLDNPFQIGDIILNEYVVKSILGKGGMGIVYLVQRQKWDTLFAVKTLRATRLNTINQKRKLMRELRTWMDLPPHPNLASCHFFRTIGDTLLIFAQYIDGGTLSQWINADSPRALTEIIDVMIQLAWGLQAAHCNGVIHQDVKPSNVLMTRDGTVKLTDFGLASAGKYTPDNDMVSDRFDSHLVSSNGMTPAYSSPEQMNYQKLSSKTDIWSYGMSVMEMFTGEVTWKVGAAGPLILERLLKNPADSWRMVMPDSIQSLLRKCFMRNPDERWTDMSAIASELKSIYLRETGTDYPRQEPTFTELPVRDALDRQSLTGDMWEDPMIWLRKAIEAADYPETMETHAIPDRKGSRRVQAIVDLEVFEIAESIYLDLIQHGQVEFEEQLAALYFQKTFVSEYLDDNVTALALMKKMIVIYKRLLEGNQSPHTAQRLFDAYAKLSSHLHHVEDFSAAMNALNAAIDLFTTLETQGLDWISPVDRAMVFENKGLLLLQEGNAEEAMINSRSAIALLRKLLDKTFDSKAMFYLGKSYTTCAGALAGKGDLHSALNNLNRGIDILEELAHRDRHPQAEMAIVYSVMNKSMLLDDLQEHQLALETLNHCEKMIKRLIREDDRTEMQFFLSTLLLKKGVLCHKTSAHQQALVYLDQSIEMFETLIERDGKPELARDLFFAYARKADVLEFLDQKDQAVFFLDRVLSILQNFDETYQLVDFGVERAHTLVKRAMLKVSLGLTQGVETDLRTAVPVLEKAKGRGLQYQQSLQAAKSYLAS